MCVVLFDVDLDRVLHVVRLLQHLLDLHVDLYLNRSLLGARLLARHKLLGARHRATLQSVRPSRLRHNR